MDNLNAEPFRQKFRAIPPNTHTHRKTTPKPTNTTKTSNTAI